MTHNPTLSPQRVAVFSKFKIARSPIFMIIDGKKRFAALRRMAAKGTLPRDLKYIPYILIDQNQSAKITPPTIVPKLLNNRDLYRQVKSLQNSGHSLMEIATELSQAKALATLAEHAQQEALMVKLGPFAQETDILRAIENGQTIMALDTDNVIILPKATPARRLLQAA